MKRFELHKPATDFKSAQGTVCVASGVEWPDGWVVVRSIEAYPGSSAVFEGSMRDLRAALYEGTTIVELDMRVTDDTRDWTLVGVCTRCLGGPGVERSHYCIDCGAGHSVVFLPAWAWADIGERVKYQFDSAVGRLEGRLDAARENVEMWKGRAEHEKGREVYAERFWAREQEAHARTRGRLTAARDKVAQLEVDLARVRGRE